jgi:hypothetical protein
MTGTARLAIGAAIAVVAVIVVQVSRSADADDHPAGTTASPVRPAAASSSATTRSTVAAKFVLSADKTQTLLVLAGIGRFTVSCPADRKLRGTFRSTANESMQAVVQRGGSAPRSAFINPGKSWAFPASPGSTTTQRWQFARINEAFSEVALVFVASSPAFGGNPGCAISAYAIGPTRQPNRK